MRKRMQENVDEAEKLYGTPKILIFDVDIEDLTRHAEPFEAHGFEVHKCMSVDTAMRCVEREELDFALLDQGSPTFEGLRVIRHLVRYNTLYAFRGADAVYRHAVSSGGIRPRSGRLLGETSPDRGHELDHQKLLRKFIEEMNCHMRVPQLISIPKQGLPSPRNAESFRLQPGARHGYAEGSCIASNLVHPSSRKRDDAARGLS